MRAEKRILVCNFSCSKRQLFNCLQESLFQFGKFKLFHFFLGSIIISNDGRIALEFFLKTSLICLLARFLSTAFPSFLVAIIPSREYGFELFCNTCRKNTSPLLLIPSFLILSNSKDLYFSRGRKILSA